MKLPTVRRRWRPAVLAGGLVAVSVAVASTVAALSGGSGAANGALGRPVSAAQGTAAPAARAGAAGSAPPGTDPVNAATLTGATTPRLIVPDVIASVPGGVTAGDLARLRRISGVRAVLAIDGARITVDGRPLTVLAAATTALRPWTTPATAGNPAIWSAFAEGDLITTPQAARAARLRSGGKYPAAGAARTTITFGYATLLGISGVDGIIDRARGRELGLVRNVAVLVNAPASSPLTLVARVRDALGGASKVIRLVPAAVSTSLPVDTTVPAGRPASYLQLFQESAARYCPGLSWTVLAAIGQIESADGQNMGPSTAGARGPMQFLPSTWAIWGIDGFGDTGPPDIMNPFDAVPSAARMLCADGAGMGGRQLRNAIFDYNHAVWYVDEVLTLAAEYAREFR